MTGTQTIVYGVDGDWYTTWGFWVGVLGAALGAAGIVWGLYARSHPKRSRLVCRISQSALLKDVEVMDPREELQVMLGKHLMPNPHLVRFSITNLGPEDLGPSVFAGGHLRFVSPPPAIDPGDLARSLRTLSIVNATTSAHIDYLESEKGGRPSVAIVVDPCLLKVNETASMTVVIAGEPSFSTEHRLASFGVQELHGDSPADFEMRVELPLPVMGSVPVTWSRRGSRS